MSDEEPKPGQRRRRRNRRSGRRNKKQGPGNQSSTASSADDGKERDTGAGTQGEAQANGADTAPASGDPVDVAGRENTGKPRRNRGQKARSPRNRAPQDRSGKGRNPHANRAERGRYRHTYGVIDLGTNNCRLLVAKPVKRGGFRVVDAYSRVVRLGEGVGQTGALSEAAMARSLDALELCSRKMHKRGVTRSWSVATQACRLADNGADFVQAVADRTGLKLDIIEPEREARLAVVGCMPLINPNVDRALVFDIGGGSTELIWLDVSGQTPQIIDLISLEVGVVTLTEQYAGVGENGLGHVDVSQQSYDAMIAQVERCMQPFAEKYATDDGAEGHKVQVLGTSGTVTTLAGVYLGLPRYDRNKVDGIWMPSKAIFDISQRLSIMPYVERIKQPCIGKERGDLVVAGCAILEAICSAWPTEQVRVADRGLREGMLIELMAAADLEDTRRDSKGEDRGDSNDQTKGEAKKGGKARRRRRGGKNRNRNRAKNQSDQARQTNAPAGGETQ